jgi:hypothetical protein
VNLKALAVKHAAFNGEATFYFLPFESLETERYIEELGRIAPQFMYTHKRNGQTQAAEPPDYREFVERAENAREAKQRQIIEANGENPLSAEQVVDIFAAERAVLDACPWTREDRWTNHHKHFCVLMANTVDIEFAEHPRPQVAALQMFWLERNGSVAKNWEHFNQALSAEAWGAWAVGYVNTRETDMVSDAPPYPQDDSDPQSSSDGTIMDGV